MERLSEFDRPWRPESWLGVTGAWRLTGVGLVLILMAGVTLLVYQTGGTSTAYLNFILIPVLLGAALMGLWGGLAFGLLAGLLLGPFMPLNVDEGIAQPTLNWVTRAGIYLVLGGSAAGCSPSCASTRRGCSIRPTTTPSPACPTASHWNSMSDN